MVREVMVKIRIYELAKELGLENKAMLDLCERLGIGDKKSHSSSLSAEEADRIRRSVIRRAVESAPGVVRDVTIKGQLVTERRVGNVVRRRRKSAEEELEEASALQMEAEHISDSTQDANDISLEAESQEVIQMVEEAEDDHDAEPDLDEELEPVDNLDYYEEATSSEEDGDSSHEALLDADPVSEDVIDASITESEPPTKEELAQENLKDIRRRHDIRAPKILGKIELPVAPVRVRPSPRKEEEVAVSDPNTVQERDSKGKVKVAKGAKVTGKKGVTKGKDREGTDDETVGDAPKRKKRQVLRRDDLLDYDSDRDSWTVRKEKKSKKRGSSPEIATGGADAAPTKASKLVIKIDQQIRVADLAHAMGVKSGELIKQLMGLGVLANINQLIDMDTATILAGEFGFSTQNVGSAEEDLLTKMREEDEEGNLSERPPVVTVMGHVDHGKTSLLDTIRSSSVTSREAGGITQHIGAYNVKLPSGGSVTFLDTPGHEAFTAMRSRGAKVTDVVVLVVAADDGVMPQTVEAINHAKAAEVPIVVAINKIDKPDANPDKIMNQLAERGLIPEEWGGNTIMIPVSAHTGAGVDLLLENLIIQSEVLELKANTDRKGRGTVVESRLDKGRGPVMTVLVQNGTLRKGDPFLVGSVSGRVRAMINDAGEMVDEVGPSIPVEVLGGSGVPSAGDEFFVITDDAEVKRLVESRTTRERSRLLSSRMGPALGPLTLESFAQMVSDNEVKELPVIVKADVQGSVEAVADSLDRLSDEKFRVKVLHKAVGAVTDNDVQLAMASSAIIVAFNIRAEPSALRMAEKEGVDIRFSRVIYELIEAIDKALKGLAEPEFRESTLGRAQVRQTFKVPKGGVIAGSYVIDGKVERGAFVRLLRDNRVVYEGKMGSLRRFKDDVKEVASGYECGIGIEGYNDIRDGDIIEIYKFEETPRP